MGGNSVKTVSPPLWKEVYSKQNKTLLLLGANYILFQYTNLQKGFVYRKKTSKLLISL